MAQRNEPSTVPDDVPLRIMKRYFRWLAPLGAVTFLGGAYLNLARPSLPAELEQEIGVTNSLRQEVSLEALLQDPKLVEQAYGLRSRRDALRGSPEYRAAKASYETALAKHERSEEAFDAIFFSSIALGLGGALYEFRRLKRELDASRAAGRAPTE